MERLRAALAEIASMRSDGLLTDEEVRSHARNSSYDKLCVHMAQGRKPN